VTVVYVTGGGVVELLEGPLVTYPGKAAALPRTRERVKSVNFILRYGELSYGLR